MIEVKYSGTCVGCQFRPKESLKDLSTAFSAPDQFDIGLEADPDNEYDPNAVKVMLVNIETEEVAHVGFIPKDETKQAAEFIDTVQEFSQDKEFISWSTSFKLMKKEDTRNPKWFNFEIVVKFAE